MGNWERGRRGATDGTDCTDGGCGARRTFSFRNKSGAQVCFTASAPRLGYDVESNGAGRVGVVLGMVAAQEFAVEHADDIAADLVRVAVGEEFGLDVGSLGPKPEQLLHFLFVFGLDGGKAEFFQ
jgi:hypothetical protein